MKTRATRMILAVLLLLNSFGSSAWAAAYSIGYQGQLRQNGVPATGAHSVVFKIYTTETGGTPVWTGPTETVSFTNGQFFSTFTPTGVDWEGTSPVLEVSIDGTALTPREALAAIPYAFNAQLHSGKKYTTATTAPSSPAAGDLWYDSAAGAFKYFNGTAWVAPTTGGGLSAVFSQSAQFSGDGSSGTPLTLLASSVTLQGNAVNVSSGLVRLDGSGRYPALDGSLISNLPSSADRVAKAGDAMTGDLQVGGATASTFSISGFITLANLGGAPTAARGRLYFDPTGAGAFKVSLDGSTFVGLATGTVAGADNSRVLKAGDTMTGALNMSGAGANIVGQSSITTSGGLFSNGAVIQGNVGIGTTTPAYPLAVIGIGSFDGIRTTNSIEIVQGNSLTLFNNNDSSVAQLANTSGVSGESYFEINVGPGAPKLVINNAGNVGIGAISPTHKLDVNGNAIIRSSLTLAGISAPVLSASGQGALYFDSTDNKFKVSENTGGYSNLLPAGGALAKAGDSMAGDLQVGGTTASTFSASGFITLANLGSAPPAAPGRLYYDTTGDGALKLRLNSGSFVSLATGTVAGADESRVLKAGDTMTGALNMSGAGANIVGQSSITTSGGLFSNGAVIQGNVGIGAPTPAYRLHITHSASYGLQIDKGGAQKLILGAGSPEILSNGDDLYLQTDTGYNIRVNPSRNLLINPGSNVGIGTLSPTHKLDVSGDAILRSSLTLAGISAPLTSAPGKGALYFDSADNKFKVSENAGGYSDLLPAGGAVAKAGDTMTGQLTNTSTVTIQGNAFSVGSSTLVVANGRVGIGTASPTVGKLNIEGANTQASIYAANSRTDGTAFGIDASATGANPSNANIGAYFAAAGGASNYAVQIPAGFPAPGANNFAIRSESLAQSYFGGNVGIGTTSPASKLHVLDGDIRVSTSAGQPSKGIVFQDGSVQTTAAGSTGGGWTDTGSVVQLTAPTDSIGSTGAGVTVSTHLIVSAGNMGIGTTSPGYKLTVQGTNGVDAEMLLNTAGTAVSSRWPCTGGQGCFDLRNSAGTQVIQLRGDTGNSYFNAGGNVGIGTTAPGARLDIQSGDATTLLQVHFGRTSRDGAMSVINTANNVFTGSSVGDIALDASGAGKKVFIGNTNADKATVFDSSGNVGIGTTSPTHKLDVNGNAIIRSSLTLAGISAPVLSASGQGALYFDSGDNKFKVSENAGGYSNLLPAGGSLAKAGDTMTGQLTNTSTITIQGNAFSVGGSTLAVVEGRVGIGTAAPSQTLEVNGNILSNGQIQHATGVTSTGGNARGSRAADLQADRGAATQVASGDFSVISGGQNNTASGLKSVVGGGFGNTASGTHSAVIGGNSNTSNHNYTMVGGGQGNTASNPWSLVAGGYQNAAGGQASTAGGGYQNSASQDYATVSGGMSNAASASYAAVGGGLSNSASGSAASVPGGTSNLAAGANSLAAGNRAKANAQGSFVWADSQAADLLNTTTDQFLVRSQGGFEVRTSSVGVVHPSAGTLFTVSGSSAQFKVPLYDTAGNLLSGGGSFVSKAGDTMTGQLTNTSTITIQGNAFSVGGSTFVVSNGRVGIGGTNPADWLDLTIPNGSGIQRVARFLAGGDGAGNGSAIGLGSSQTIAAHLRGIQTNSNSGDLALATTSGGALNEHLRILSGGNVGIGTTAPAAKLDVQAGSGASEAAVFRNPAGVAVATITASGVFAGTNQWSFTIYDPGGLVATDDVPSIIAARISSATIKEVWCESDDAAASINLEKFDGATTSILTGDLTCGTSGSSSASFTASANLNLNNKINFLLQSIGAGAKRINVVIKYALN